MMAERTPNLAQLAAEGMMSTAYYLRRAVGRANFITGEPESALVSPPLDRQARDRRYAAPEL